MSQPNKGNPTVSQDGGTGGNQPQGGVRIAETNDQEPPTDDQPRQGRRTTFQLKGKLDEAHLYDFVSNRPPAKTSNIIESIGNLIKSCLGGGVVTIHEAYMSLGLWLSLGLNVVLGIFVTYLMLVLTKSAQKVYGRVHVPQLTYPDLAEASLDICPFPRLRRCSKVFRYAVDATIMIDLFGSCCCYQVLIASTVKALLINTGYNGPFLHLRVLIACLLVPCISICMILSLKKLAHFSVAADIVIVIVAVSTVVYGIRGAHRSFSEFPIFKDVKGLFQFLGVCVFSMEGVGVTLPVENQMTDPRKIGLVLWIAMSVVIAIVMTVGFFGYYGFGEAAAAPVTNNFPVDWYTLCLRAGLGLMVYVTFALNFWVPFNLVWVYMKKWHAEEKLWIYERLYRAAFVTVITLIAVAFPDVAKLMSVIGVFCLSNMGFIYPAFIELMLDWEYPGLGPCKWRLWKFILIFLFGATLMIYGTISNSIELIRAAMKAD